ncbi:MAG TPA: hypothetical protein VIW45_12435, partial [Vicinamibacterales bacterium]
CARVFRTRAATTTTLAPVIQRQFRAEPAARDDTAVKAPLTQQPLKSKPVQTLGLGEAQFALGQYLSGTIVRTKLPAVVLPDGTTLQPEVALTYELRVSKRATIFYLAKDGTRIDLRGLVNSISVDQTLWGKKTITFSTNIPGPPKSSGQLQFIPEKMTLVYASSPEPAKFTVGDEMGEGTITLEFRLKVTPPLRLKALPLGDGPAREPVYGLPPLGGPIGIPFPFPIPVL